MAGRADRNHVFYILDSASAFWVLIFIFWILISFPDPDFIFFDTRHLGDPGGTIARGPPWRTAK